MSRICQLTGKKTSVGNSVSHSLRHTKRKFYPNLFWRNVRDPETGRYINVDVKTPSSFRHRLEDLVQQGRLTEQELLLADERSYVVETNGKNGGSIQVIVLCILPDKFGEFGHFRLQNSEPMRQMLNFLIREYGLSDGRYGIHK